MQLQCLQRALPETLQWWPPSSRVYPCWQAQWYDPTLLTHNWPHTVALAHSSTSSQVVPSSCRRNPAAQAQRCAHIQEERSQESCDCPVTAPSC